MRLLATLIITCPVFVGCVSFGPADGQFYTTGSTPPDASSATIVASRNFKYGQDVRIGGELAIGGGAPRQVIQSDTTSRRNLTQAGTSMTFSAAFATIVLASSLASPELCHGVDHKIEPDMRILESDLSQPAAIEAAGKLKDMVARGELAGEFKFGALNQSKIIHGHILLRQATTDREEFGPDSAESKESTTSLCNWLSTEGFWHD